MKKALAYTEMGIDAQILEQLKLLYIGIDLHKAEHTAVLMNYGTKTLDVITFENKPAAFPEFLANVNKRVPKGMTPVYGLEDTGGYGRALAVFLVEQQQIVKEVNPALAFEKRRKRTQRRKSDAVDAESIAKVLRDEYYTLPDAKPIDHYWAIGQLVTRRKGLVKNLQVLNIQLHTQISHHYPSYKKFFSQIDGKTALEFWGNYPSPHHLEGVSVEKLAEFLRKHSNRALSAKKAEQILALVVEDGDTKRDYQANRDFIIQSHVRNIRYCIEEIEKVDEQLQELVKELGCTLDTMYGIDIVTAAYFIAEIGDIHRFRSANHLASHAGIAPVPDYSGGENNLRNRKNKLGNRALHDLFYDLAIRQIGVARGTKKPNNPVFFLYYEKKMKEDRKTKKQSLICIMRRLVNIIYRMLKHNEQYIKPDILIEKTG